MPRGGVFGPRAKRRKLGNRQDNEQDIGIFFAAQAQAQQQPDEEPQHPINANKAASLVLARMGSMESKGFMLKKSSA